MDNIMKKSSHIFIGQYSPGVPEELNDGCDGGESHSHDEDEEGSGHVLHGEGLGCGGGRLTYCLAREMISNR